MADKAAEDIMSSLTMQSADVNKLCESLKSSEGGLGIGLIIFIVVLLLLCLSSSGGLGWWLYARQNK